MPGRVERECDSQDAPPVDGTRECRHQGGPCCHHNTAAKHQRAGFRNTDRKGIGQFRQHARWQQNSGPDNEIAEKQRPDGASLGDARRDF